MKVDTSILMVGIRTFCTISIVVKHSIDLTKTRQSQVHLEKNDDNSLFFYFGGKLNRFKGINLLH